MGSETNESGGGVILIASALQPTFGLELAVMEVAQALAESREVTVICVADGNPSPFPAESGIAYRSLGSSVVKWRRVAMIPRILRLARTLPDQPIVLCGAWAAIPALLALGRRHSSRAVVWEHSFGSTRRLRRLTRLLYPRGACVVAVSDRLASDLKGAGFDVEMSVIPNIVRPVGLVADVEVRPNALVTVGSLKPIKNHALALHTLAELGADYTLDVVGDGPLRESLEGLARELGVADRVVFHGYVADPSPLVASSAVMLHTSIGETFGLVLHEAAQVGCPVVAIDDSVMQEVVPAQVPGVLSAPDPGALAEAVRRAQALERPAPITPEEQESRRREVIDRWSALLDDVGRM